MQGGYNLFFLAIAGKIDKALKEAQDPTHREDHQYNNGYYQGLVDAHKLALEIHHSKDYFE